MRRFRTPPQFPLLALLVLSLGWSLAGAERRSPLSFSDLLDLAGLGLDPAVISTQVEKLGLDFEPTPRQLAALKQAGLSPDVLAGILRQIDLRSGSHVPIETVRIFRQQMEDGRVALVLTNLDEQGNRMVDPEDPGIPPPRPSASAPTEAAGCAAPEAPQPEEARAPGPAPTVVVNVQAPPPSLPVIGFPLVAVGGIAGPYEYPLPLPFLGYGHGISTPGWFSGLGLNAANNFGHRPQDKPNTTGLGAFFGPPSR